MGAISRREEKARGEPWGTVRGKSSDDCGGWGEDRPDFQGKMVVLWE